MSKCKHLHIVTAELESLVETVTPSTTHIELFEVLAQVQSLIAATKLRKVEDKAGMPSLLGHCNEADDTFSSL